MNKKTIGLILLVIGTVVLLISGFADILGYGEGNFGPKQGVGVIVGLILMILGWLWWKGKELSLPSLSQDSIDIEQDA